MKDDDSDRGRVYKSLKISRNKNKLYNRSTLFMFQFVYEGISQPD